MAGTFDSPQDAVVALSTNQELMGIAKKYGYELWAVIDPETSAIKEVSTGFSRSHAVGVYDGAFSNSSFGVQIR